MGMTMTQKILAAHAGLPSVEAGQLIEADLDLVLGNDVTTPVAIHEMEKFNKKEVFDKKKIALVMDHFTPNKDIKSAEHCKCVRQFSAANEIENYFDVGAMGIEHALLPEKGLIVAGETCIGADSHTCTYGALGAFSTGVGSTDMAAGMVTGKAWFKVPSAIKFIHLGSYLQGHPCIHIPGVDMSSGSLGQGISAAVGMALGAKMENRDFRVYTLLGDGEIEEGQVWEAAMFAGFRKLDNLCVMVDNNNLQIDGPIDQVCSPYPIDKKFEAFNFHVINADAHDFDAIRAAFKEARETKGMPTCIVFHSIKGKGVSFMENSVDWHGKAPNDEEYAIAMADLDKIEKELEKAGEQ